MDTTLTLPAELQGAIDEAIAAAVGDRWASRVWASDTSLWTDDPEVAHVVMLRYFSGLTVEETAEVLGLSRKTITRRWRYAKAWLQRAMGTSGGDDAETH